MRSFFSSAALLVSALAFPTGATAQPSIETITEYGQRCESLIGPMPQFDCMADGVPIPITRGGVAVAASAAPMDCDKPAWIFNGDSPVRETACYPGSRMGRIETGNPDTEIVFICRKKRAGTLPHVFQDVAVIHHRISTGATCWYQALEDDLDGSNVPSPTAAAAAAFWLSPGRTAGENCVSCHENDPIMLSPYVEQTGVLDDVQIFHRGSYVSVGPDFASWPTPVRFKLPSSECNTCHTLGALQDSGGMAGNSRRFWAEYATGAESHPNQYDTPPRFMPPPSTVASDPDIAASVARYLACASAAEAGDPLPSDCGAEAVPGQGDLAEYPDLSVDSVIARRQGDVALVRVSLSNQGLWASPAFKIHVDLVDGDGNFEATHVHSVDTRLDPTQTHDVEIPVPLFAGSQIGLGSVARVHVDATEWVAEPREDNNLIDQPFAPTIADIQSIIDTQQAWLQGACTAATGLAKTVCDSLSTYWRDDLRHILESLNGGGGEGDRLAFVIETVMYKGDPALRALAESAFDEVQRAQKGRPIGLSRTYALLRAVVAAPMGGSVEGERWSAIDRRTWLRASGRDGEAVQARVSVMGAEMPRGWRLAAGRPLMRIDGHRESAGIRVAFDHAEQRVIGWQGERAEALRLIETRDGVELELPAHIDRVAVIEPGR